MPYVPDPNCDGRGWVPFYTGADNADGTPAFSHLVPDIRCGGSGVVWVDEIFPQSLTEYFAEETAAGVPNAGAYASPDDGQQVVSG